jgi:hypothetical protein
MSKAYVIMCNDSPDCVVIGYEDLANEIMEQKRSKHLGSYVAFGKKADEYDDIYNWHVEECPYFMDDFSKKLP